MNAAGILLGLVEFGKVHGEEFEGTCWSEGDVGVVRVGALADGDWGAAGVEGAVAGGEDEVRVGVAAADAQAARAGDGGGLL